jgi:hypothetical protein
MYGAKTCGGRGVVLWVDVVAVSDTHLGRGLVCEQPHHAVRARMGVDLGLLDHHQATRGSHTRLVHLAMLPALEALVR